MGLTLAPEFEMISSNDVMHRRCNRGKVPSLITTDMHSTSSSCLLTPTLPPTLFSQDG